MNINMISPQSTICTYAEQILYERSVKSLDKKVKKKRSTDKIDRISSGKLEIDVNIDYESEYAQDLENVHSKMADGLRRIDTLTSNLSENSFGNFFKNSKQNFPTVAGLLNERKMRPELNDDSYLKELIEGSLAQVNAENGHERYSTEAIEDLAVWMAKIAKQDILIDKIEGSNDVEDLPNESFSTFKDELSAKMVAQSTKKLHLLFQQLIALCLEHKNARNVLEMVRSSEEGASAAYTLKRAVEAENEVQNINEALEKLKMKYRMTDARRVSIEQQQQHESAAWKEVATEYEMKVLYLERCLAQEECKVRMFEQANRTNGLNLQLEMFHGDSTDMDEKLTPVKSSAVIRKLRVEILLLQRQLQESAENLAERSAEVDRLKANAAVLHAKTADELELKLASSAEEYTEIINNLESDFKKCNAEIEKLTSIVDEKNLDAFKLNEKLTIASKDIENFAKAEADREKLFRESEEYRLQRLRENCSQTDEFFIDVIEKLKVEAQLSAEKLVVCELNYASLQKNEEFICKQNKELIIDKERLENELNTALSRLSKAEELAAKIPQESFCFPSNILNTENLSKELREEVLHWHRRADFECDRAEALSAAIAESNARRKETEDACTLNFAELKRFRREAGAASISAQHSALEIESLRRLQVEFEGEMGQVEVTIKSVLSATRKTGLLKDVESMLCQRLVAVKRLNDAVRLAKLAKSQGDMDEQVVIKILEALSAMGMSKSNLNNIILNRSPKHFHSLLQFWLQDGILQRFIDLSKEVHGKNLLRDLKPNHPKDDRKNKHHESLSLSPEESILALSKTQLNKKSADIMESIKMQSTSVPENQLSLLDDEGDNQLNGVQVDNSDNNEENVDSSTKIGIQESVFQPTEYNLLKSTVLQQTEMNLQQPELYVETVSQIQRIPPPPTLLPPSIMDCAKVLGIATALGGVLSGLKCLKKDVNDENDEIREIERQRDLLLLQILFFSVDEITDAVIAVSNKMPKVEGAEEASLKLTMEALNVSLSAADASKVSKSLAKLWLVHENAVKRSKMVDIQVAENLNEHNIQIADAWHDYVKQIEVQQLRLLSWAVNKLGGWRSIVYSDPNQINIDTDVNIWPIQDQIEILKAINSILVTRLTRNITDESTFSVKDSSAKDENSLYRSKSSSSDFQSLAENTAFNSVKIDGTDGEVKFERISRSTSIDSTIEVYTRFTEEKETMTLDQMPPIFIADVPKKEKFEIAVERADKGCDPDIKQNSMDEHSISDPMKILGLHTVINESWNRVRERAQNLNSSFFEDLEKNSSSKNNFSDDIIAKDLHYLQNILRFYENQAKDMTKKIPPSAANDTSFNHKSLNEAHELQEIAPQVPKFRIPGDSSTQTDDLVILLEKPVDIPFFEKNTVQDIKSSHSDQNVILPRSNHNQNSDSIEVLDVLHPSITLVSAEDYENLPILPSLNESTNTKDIDVEKLARLYKAIEQGKIRENYLEGMMKEYSGKEQNLLVEIENLQSTISNLESALVAKIEAANKPDISYDNRIELLEQMRHDSLAIAQHKQQVETLNVKHSSLWEEAKQSCESSLGHHVPATNIGYLNNSPNIVNWMSNELRAQRKARQRMTRVALRLERPLYFEGQDPPYTNRLSLSNTLKTPRTDFLNSLDLGHSASLKLSLARSHHSYQKNQPDKIQIQGTRLSVSRQDKQQKHNTDSESLISNLYVNNSFTKSKVQSFIGQKNNEILNKKLVNSSGFFSSESTGSLNYRNQLKYGSWRASSLSPGPELAPGKLGQLKREREIRPPIPKPVVNVAANQKLKPLLSGVHKN